MNSRDYTSAAIWEGQVKSEHQWCKQLSIDDAEFRALLSDGIFKPFKSKSSNEFRLDLVGLLFTKRGAFVSLPKIFKNKVNNSLIRDVIATIRIYRNRVKRKIRHVEISESLSIHDESAKWVDLFLAISDWTVEFGFQSEDMESHCDELSDIDWVATMFNGIPLHIGNSIIYSETVGRKTEYKLGPLALLQARAILELHEKLSPIADFWISGVDPLMDSARKISEDITEDNDDFVRNLPQLVDYLNVCNKDHDRELGNLLYYWLRNQVLGSSHVTAYGTTAFQYVWEDMCDVLTSNIGEAVEHGEIASRPVYTLCGHEKKADSQRPDILRISGNQVSIYDAKWYHVEKGDYPGTSDVIKQIMYKETITEKFQVEQNAFIVPLFYGHKKFCDLGEVKLVNDDGDDTSFSPVMVIGLPWAHAVSAYFGLSRVD